MKLLVQKFGGTSVAKPESRQIVFQKIKAAKDAGYAVVAVVSAMGRRGDPYATDTLLDLFAGGHELPNSREQDMIYVCGEIISGSIIANELSAQGVKCVFLTGGQAGIVTTDNYSDAPIITVRPEPVKKWLDQGYTVIVAGGQGMTEGGDFTSLGRGGSDTTACALGCYLDADEVRIYTDVDGVYTGDPRVIKNAAPLPDISYEQCRTLAELGAKVIHPKAVAFSQKGGRNVLSVRSTFTDNEGTRIGDYDTPRTGITALRGQVLAAVKKDALAAATLPESAVKLGEDAATAYFCVDPRRCAGLEAELSAACDVIFVVGTDVGKKLDAFSLDQEGIESGWKVSDTIAAVLVRSENYEELINKIHDYFVDL